MILSEISVIVSPLSASFSSKSVLPSPSSTLVPNIMQDVLNISSVGNGFYVGDTSGIRRIII